MGWLLVALRFVGMLHQVAGLPDVVPLFTGRVLDLLGAGEQVFRLLVVSLRTDGSRQQPPRAEEVFALD